MARPLRLEFAGALYHLTSRGNRREPIFESDDDRRGFLSVLDDVCETQGHFVLPADTWMRDYYEPMELILAEKIKLWEGAPQGQAVIEEAQQEIALYHQYSDYYGYAFFVMKCPQ